jgi:glycerol-3-phosphate dehydrogenase
VKKISTEPKALKKEIEFLLTHAGKYLTKDPTPKDILSVFAGLRPLIRANKGENTAVLSRDHTILVSKSGLITIAGGKWTTYRKMAEDVINKASTVAGLPERNCLTKSLKLHGYKEGLDPLQPLSTYGTFGKEIKKIARQKREWGTLLHPKLPYLGAEVIWTVRYEMARTLEDVLSRRTRSLLLDAAASQEIAPLVVKWMAKELKKDSKWEKNQLSEYVKVSQHYQVR